MKPKRVKTGRIFIQFCLLGYWFGAVKRWNGFDFWITEGPQFLWFECVTFFKYRHQAFGRTVYYSE